MNINWQIMIRIFIVSFIGGAIGYLAVGALGILVTSGFAALPLIFSVVGHMGIGGLLGALLQPLLFAAMYAFSVYQRVAMGVGLDMRWALINGLMWGGIMLLFGLFPWPGLVMLLIFFWQGVALSVGAFIALGLMP